MNEKCQNTAGSWEAETAENQNGRNDGKLMRLCVESVFEEYEDELTDPDDIQNMGRMLEMFDESDDIQEVYHNWENEDDYE